VKKLLQKGQIHDIESIKKIYPVEDNGIIIASRVGSQCYTRNFEVYPSESFSMKYDSDANELVIRVKMNDGDFLALYDCKGEKDVEYL
jgi:hypothetical protein